LTRKYTFFAYCETPKEKIPASISEFDVLYKEFILEKSVFNITRGHDVMCNPVVYGKSKSVMFSFTSPHQNSGNLEKKWTKYVHHLIGNIQISIIHEIHVFITIFHE
jgi:hypothetical protein